jgi:TonB family protein
MLLPRRILGSLLILPFLPLFAYSQGPIAPPASSAQIIRGYPNSPDGLRWQLQDILNAARDHSHLRLESLIKQTEMPNYEEWFTRTFGKEKGDSWAGAYARNLGENEKYFEDVLTRLAGEDGEFLTRKVNDDPVPARKMEVGMVEALQRPADILFASWKKRGSPPDSKSSPISYFVFLEGRFRLDSAISSTEIQLEPGTDSAAPRDVPPTRTALGPNNLPASGMDDGVSRPGAGGIGYPSCDDCPQPAYTKLARAKRLEGTVVFQVIIQADGDVTDIKVLKSPDAELTQMAIDGVSRWHMNPARRADCEPVPVRVPIEVTFRLVK